MFNQMIVQEALKRTCVLGKSKDLTNENLIGGQDTEISFLIHDIFGGEILKTHKKKGWHFYNRIDGERFDFTNFGKNKSTDDNHFEDILSTPDETHNYFVTEDYSTFFMRFVRVFEEVIGLERSRPDYAA